MSDHTKAREIAQRFINSHFNNPGEHARTQIPADPNRCDDLLLMAYIEANESRDKEAETLREALRVTKEALEAEDAWRNEILGSLREDLQIKAAHLRKDALSKLVALNPHTDQ